MTTAPKPAKGLLHAICDRLTQEKAKFTLSERSDQQGDGAISSQSTEFGDPIAADEKPSPDHIVVQPTEFIGKSIRKSGSTFESDFDMDTKPKGARQKRADGTWRRKYVRSSVVSADISTLDSSRYIQKFASWDDCGIEQCRNGIVGREHFHCASPECDSKLFTKKDDMLRHCKWHYRKDEAKVFGFLRFCPTDDCSAQFGNDCDYNKKQTHYHCEQENCKKVYVSTSDVQIHASYHKKMADLMSIGFQRFRGTDECGGHPWCPYVTQRTAHYHCIRDACQQAYKNKADLEKHRHCHDRDDALLSGTFKKFTKLEASPVGCYSRQYQTQGAQPGGGFVSLGSVHAGFKRKHERTCLDDEPPTQIMRKSLLGADGLDSSVWTQVHHGKLAQQNNDSSATFANMESDDSDSENGQLVIDITHSPNVTNDVRSHSDGASQANGTTSSEPDRDASQTTPGSAVKARQRDEMWKSYLKRYTANDPCLPHCELLYKDHYHCIVRGCSQFFKQKEAVRDHARLHQRDDQLLASSFKKSDAAVCGDNSCHLNDVHFHCTSPNCKFVTNLNDPPLTCVKHQEVHESLAYVLPTATQQSPTGLPTQSVVAVTNLGLTNSASEAFSLLPKKRRGRPPKYLKEMPTAVQPPAPKPDKMSATGIVSNMNLLDFARSLSAVINNSTNSTTNSSSNILQQQPAVAVPATAPSVQQRSPCASESHADELTMEHFLNSPTRVVHQFKMFLPTEKCPDDKCPFIAVQHFHCLRERCHHSSVRLDLLNLHFRSFHSLIRILDGFEFFDRNVQCRRAHCPNSKVNAHFHCTKPRCDYSFVRYSTMAKHSRKHAETEKGSGTLPMPSFNVGNCNGQDDKTVLTTPTLSPSTAGSMPILTACGIKPAAAAPAEMLKFEAEAAMRAILQLLTASSGDLSDPALRSQLMQYIEIIQNWCRALVALLQATKVDESAVANDVLHVGMSLQSSAVPVSELTQSMFSAFKPVLRSQRSNATVSALEQPRQRRMATERSPMRSARSHRESAPSMPTHNGVLRSVDERPLNLTVHE